ncbi:MAG TPA: thermonuclease family protein [Pyrinomonadaceae bacterium]|nr:thermonuclease family protein [Pyrinomonadaceae bacterium]
MKLNRPLAAAIVSLTVSVSTFAQKLVFQAKVIDVIDGSTVAVETQNDARFVVKCQATPVPQPPDPYADHSKQRFSSLLLGKTVAVEYSARNEYGHLLGTIFLNGEDVCLDQIAAGLARFDPQTPNDIKPSRRDLYATTEDRARTNGSGIWTISSASAASSIIKPNTSNNGMAVTSHKRTAPDDKFDDNWSTVGNVNLYTGKPGTKSWFARNWWIFPTVGALVGTGFLLHRTMGSTGSIGGIQCNDGTVSQAQNRQGACSHHGGIR